MRAMVVPLSSLGPLWSVLSTLILSGKVEITVPGVGRLRGSSIRSTERRRPINSFWGVPYAEPPTHNLRLILFKDLKVICLFPDLHHHNAAVP